MTSDAVLKLAREIVARRYQNIRDPDYAGWVLQGLKDSTNDVQTAIAAIEATAERTDTLQTGDKVEILLPEWRSDPPQYIVGIDWHGKHGVTYTTSETWPPRWDGLRASGLTDEWQSQHLRLVPDSITGP